MLVMMEIEKHIPRAKKIFIDGKDFDTERIDFIKNFDTCDLLAVPGSGKTTALMAKLYCLAQNMPFEDGSGILVLAHTHNAIDEIENKLKKHCPHLFEYPNFVGTVQGFVNKFLANQACFKKYNSYIKKNEDEIPSKKLTSSLKKLPKFGNQLMTYFFNQIYPKYAGISQKELQEKLNINKDRAKEYFDLLNSEKILKYGKLDYYKVKEIENNTIDPELKNFLFLKNTSILKKVEEEKFEKGLHYKLDFLNKKFTNDSSSFGFEKKSGEILLEQYEIIFEEGSLRYIDSFSFGEWYLENYAVIKTILQKRFKYVFIDEMQDLEEFQIKIIDDIFFNESSKTLIQRIGDKNQSIYNSVKENCDWVTREEKEPKKYTDLKIQNSIRLSPTIGRLVDCFVLERPKDYKVIGVKEIEGGCIPPHLILFNKNTTGIELQTKFNEIICKNKLQDCDKNRKNGFHIISWTTEKDDENSEKIYLKKLFPEFIKESKQKKEDYNCLRKHLFLFDKEKNTFGAIRKSILNALIRILRYEDIYKDKTKKHFYRKSHLIEFFKNQKNDFYNDFNIKLFSWCYDIIGKKNHEEVYIKIKEFIESDCFISLNWENDENYIPKLIIKSKDFINKEFDFDVTIEDSKEMKSQPSVIDIKLSSVHAVKGKTHCATMYIESAYQNPVYETLKFKTKKPFLFEEHKCKGVYDKQALKMMYVGFSRPTHLLCFAVLEENVKDDKAKLVNAGWKWDNTLLK